MVVGFITAYAISAYHHKGCEFEPLLIQPYVIKFVSDLKQVCGFLRVLRFPPSIKTDRHDIPEILLKMSFNTINQPYPTDSCFLTRLYNKTSVNIGLSGQYDTTFTT
jgi:hypothetical protein